MHPFTRVPCEVLHLNPGDVVEAGDLYRSVTVTEAKSDLGRWFMAGDVIAGTVIGPTCNVHFIRPIPIPGAFPVVELTEDELLDSLSELEACDAPN